MTTNTTQDTLGPLSNLVGTWKGDKGLNIISVPSRKSNPRGPGDAEVLIRPYEETIVFTAVDGPVRNRGGEFDQFIGAVRYELQIHATDGDKELLHIENGMWLYLDDITTNDGSEEGSSGPQTVKAEFSIARSATIPHGDSALVMGDFSVSDGKPTIDWVSPHAQNVGPTARNGYAENGFPHPGNDPLNASNPNKNLKDVIDQQEIISTTTYVLDSENQGAVNNIPFIVGSADATRFQCTFWVETVKCPDTGGTFEQLQYSQNIDLLFDQRFGEEGLILWPHINVNTLIKVS